MKTRVGIFLESIETQTAVSILIYIDLFLCTIFHIASLDPSNDPSNVNDLPLSMNVIMSLLQFNQVAFIIEITGAMYSFGMSFFRHVGYTLDLTIISAIVFSDNVLPLGLRFLRVWRFWRLLTSTQMRAQSLNENDLLQCQEQMQAASMEVKRLGATCKKECTLREEIEKHLIAYKDEIDTLKEALQIAALDIVGINNTDFENDNPEMANSDTIAEKEIFFDGNEVPDRISRIKNQ